METVLDLGNKVNAMIQTFAHYLVFKIRNTNIGGQKIDGITLKTYKIVVFTFSISDKDNKERFFKKSFLLADIKSNVVLGILFLTINNADIDFQA